MTPVEGLRILHARHINVGMARLRGGVPTRSPWWGHGQVECRPFGAAWGARAALAELRLLGRPRRKERFVRVCPRATPERTDGKMSRGRLLIVVGGLVSLCASAGLLLFGPSVVRVLDVLTWRLGEPEGEALGGLLAAAICALLFAVGVGLACGGQVVASRRQAPTITGRLLLALVGAGGVCAALAIIGGVLGAQRALYTVANTGRKALR